MAKNPLGKDGMSSVKYSPNTVKPATISGPGISGTNKGQGTKVKSIPAGKTIGRG